MLVFNAIFLLKDKFELQGFFYVHHSLQYKCKRNSTHCLRADLWFIFSCKFSFFIYKLTNKNFSLISGSSQAQFLDTKVKIGSFYNLNCELLSVLCVLFGILLFLISRVLVKLLSQWHLDQGRKAGVEVGP